MKQALFFAFGQAFDTYPIVLGFSFLLAFIYLLRAARYHHLDRIVVIDLAIVVLISSILGAKLLFIATRWQEDYARLFQQLLHSWHQPLLAVDDVLRFWSGGLVFYGGFIAASVAAIGYLFIRRLPIAVYCDLMAPAIGIGLGFGRGLGCFLAGCCFGRPTDLSWGVIFPPGAPSYLAYGPNCAVHPVQLYEAALAVVLAVALHFYRQQARYRGQVSAGFLIGYSVVRFGLEYFRGDLVRGYWGSLSTSQWISLGVGLIGVGTMIFARARKIPNPARITER